MRSRIRRSSRRSRRSRAMEKTEGMGTVRMNLKMCIMDLLTITEIKTQTQVWHDLISHQVSDYTYKLSDKLTRRLRQCICNGWS